MELDVEPVFTLKLSRQELLTISKALRGALKPDELEAAQELQKRIVTLRHKQFEHMLHESKKLMDNLEPAKGGTRE